VDGRNGKYECGDGKCEIWGNEKNEIRYKKKKDRKIKILNGKYGGIKRC
jgi:hypothetical protein